MPGVDLEGGRGLAVGRWGPCQLQFLQGEMVEERARVFDCSVLWVWGCVWFWIESVRALTVAYQSWYVNVVHPSTLLALGDVPPGHSKERTPVGLCL